MCKIKLDIKAISEQIHRRPELGNEEFETSALIESALHSMQIPTVKMAGTGVVGLIDGGKDKTLLLRADMDALPIQENTGLPFSSEIDGKMHACGHDSHVAMLLGAAQELMNRRDELGCNVKLVFQPDEEGDGGALRMIDEGVLENPHVDAAFAFHVWPEFECGVVGIKEGVLTATCDEFQIVIRGYGGHVAKPELHNNPITAAAEIIAQINAIDINEAHIVEVCNISAGNGVNNIVPDKCVISGAMRVISSKGREIIPQEIEKVLRRVESQHGVSCELTPKLFPQFPPMINDKTITQKVEKFIEKFAKIRRLESPYFIAEDFACFADSGVPSAMVLLGCSPIDRLGNNDLHKSDMVVDECTIDLGIRILTDFAKNYAG